MVNFYIFVKDYSGSAKEDQEYHDNYTKELVKRFKSDMEKIKEEESVPGEATVIYITWETMCYVVEEAEIYSKKIEWTLKGMEGRPEEVISSLQHIFRSTPGKNTIKLLYMMTKNVIDSTSIATCFAMNDHANYENFVFHAFHKDVTKINLSIASPFLKKRCAIYRNFELIDEIDISGEFDYNKINVNNFATEKNQLKSYIRLKFINKFKHYTIVLRELTKLEKLWWRLYQESKQKLSRKSEIHRFIVALIDYVASKKNNYSFDSLKFDDIVEEELKEYGELVDPVVEDNSEMRQIIRNKFNWLENAIVQKAKKLVHM